MIRGYTYVNLSLFPVYINDSHSINQNQIGIQRYNSSQWMSYLNNSEPDSIHTLVSLSNKGYKEDPSDNYYQNFQLITDLFDVIMTKQSEFRNQEIHEEIDYMLRKKEYPVDLSTDNRYTARFLKFHPQNYAIVLIANLASQNCRTLIKKRQRLNEYL